MLKVFFCVVFASICFLTDAACMELREYTGCPICRDTWVPIPIYHNYASQRGTNNNGIAIYLPKVVSMTSIDQREDVNGQEAIDVDLGQNIQEKIRDIATSNGRVNIYFGPLPKNHDIPLSVLKLIDTSKIATLDLRRYRGDLDEDIWDWILSLSSLEGLAIAAKNISTDSFEKLSNLKNLRTLWCFSNSSTFDTEIICRTVSALPAIESLSLSGMNFATVHGWSIPSSLKKIKLSFSELPTRILEIIGEANHLSHASIVGCQLKLIPQQCFPETIRCIETDNRNLSLLVIKNLEKLKHLKFLLVSINEKDYAILEERIGTTKNILRVLILCGIRKSRLTDRFIEKMRKDYAIYVNYDSEWTELCLSASCPQSEK